jgi:NADH:ubiquinone oxidoreductase subunit F (NADH-binding)
VSRIAAAESDVHVEALPRLLDGLDELSQTVSLELHRRRHGPLPQFRRGSDIVELVRAAGLRGCGGAGFPTATKLEAVAEGGRRPVVVANGAEGEPVSSKDKVLLAYAPHLVLDGVVLAAHAVGAREAIVACNPSAHFQVDAAIAQRARAGATAGVRLRAVAVPDRFVAGEETALVRFLDGGPSLPTFGSRPFERGVGGAPTLVQNIETLAHLALIARHGSDWFRALGTAEQPGSTLVTLSGAVSRPGVYEVAYGEPLAQLLARAGGAAADLQAVLVGGYFGTWISADEAARVRLSDADLAGVGAALGARAIVALPESACGLVETARVARYLADESAHQCGPCTHGLAAVADDLAALLRHDRRVDDGRLRRRLGVIAGRGACRHPDGAVRFVASALRVFDHELQRHLHGSRCSRGGGDPVLRVPSAAGAAR